MLHNSRNGCFVFRREKIFTASLFNIFRTDFSVPLGSPLLGTTVEVRDDNGSAVLEGEGQVFIGYFIFFVLLRYFSYLGFSNMFVLIFFFTWCLPLINRLM